MTEEIKLKLLKEAIVYGNDKLEGMPDFARSEELNSHYTVIINEIPYDLHEEAKIKYEELIKDYEAEKTI